jgi:uncharacterized phage infection (PIP) family protein YhgE
MPHHSGYRTVVDRTRPDSFSTIAVPVFEQEDLVIVGDDGDLTIASGPSDFTDGMYEYMKWKESVPDMPKPVWQDNVTIDEGPRTVIGLTEENGKLRDRVDQLVDGLSKLFEMFEHTASVSEKHKVEVDQLTANNKTLTDTVDSLKASTEEFRATVQQLQTTKDLADSTVDGLIDDNEKLKAKITELTLENEQFACSNHELRENNRGFRESIKDLTAKPSNPTDGSINLANFQQLLESDGREAMDNTSRQLQIELAASKTAMQKLEAKHKAAVEKLETEHKAAMQKLEDEQKLAIEKQEAAHKLEMNKQAAANKRTMKDVKTENATHISLLENMNKEQHLEIEQKNPKIRELEYKVEALTARLRQSVSRNKYDKIKCAATDYRRLAESQRIIAQGARESNEDWRMKQEKEIEELRYAVRVLDKDRTRLCKEQETLIARMEGMASISNKVSKRLMWEWGQHEVGPVEGGMGYKYESTETVLATNNRKENEVPEEQ